MAGKDVVVESKFGALRSPSAPVPSFSVRCVESKSTHRPVFCLVADLGYAVKFLSWDRSLCAELLGISVSALVSNSAIGDVFDL